MNEQSGQVEQAVIELIEQLSDMMREDLAAETQEYAPIKGDDKMARRYVYKLRSNVKSRSEEGFEVELGPRTLVLGPNGTGKDRVIQALQLATRGSANDLAGKGDVKQALRLMALAPGQEGSLWAEVEMSQESDDGQKVYRFETEGSTEKAKRPTGGSVFNAVFPLQEIRTLFQDQGEDAQRAYFVERLGAQITLDDVHAVLPRLHHEMLDALWLGTSDKQGGGQRLVEVRAEAAKLKRKAKKEAKNAGIRREGAASNADGSRPTAAQIKEAEARAQEARRLQEEAEQQLLALRRQEAQDIGGAQARIERLRRRQEAAQREVRRLDAHLEELRPQGRQAEEAVRNARSNLAKAEEDLKQAAYQVEQFKGGLADLPAPDPGREQAIEAMRAAIKILDQQAKATAAGNLDQCICCGSSITATQATRIQAQRVPQLHTQISQLQSQDTERHQRQAALERELAQWTEAYAQLETYISQQRQSLHTWEGQLASITEDYDITSAKVGESSALAAEISEELAKLTQVPEEDEPNESIQQAEARLQALRGETSEREQELASLQAASKAYGAVNAERDKAAKAQKMASEYEALERAVTEAMGEILEGQRAAFVNKVRSYMPSPKKLPRPIGAKNGGVFDLRLNDGGRSVCQIGLKVPGLGYLTALSGVQWNIVMTAIACALSEDSEFALIIPEERAYDGKTLANWIRSLEKSPAQIVWTSPVKYKGRKPKGLVVIKTDEIGGMAAAEDEEDEEEEEEDEGAEGGATEEEDEEEGDEEEEDEAKREAEEVLAAAQQADSESVPGWIKSAGEAIWRGDVQSLHEVAESLFGEKLHFREKHRAVDLSGEECGVWREALNGAVVYQSGQSMTLYRGSSEAATE